MKKAHCSLRTRTDAHTLSGGEHHYHPALVDDENYTAKLIFRTLPSGWQERRRRRKDTIINKFCPNQHIWVGRIKENSREKWSWGSNLLKLLCFFFIMKCEPIIMKRVNWILFFHLSNNWFDISLHFKGSLAQRLCSKLQYKAEDLLLAECQVCVPLRLPSPTICPALSHPPLSLFPWISSPTLSSWSSWPCLCPSAKLCLPAHKPPHSSVFHRHSRVCSFLEEMSFSAGIWYVNNVQSPGTIRGWYFDLGMVSWTVSSHHLLLW